MVLVLSHRLHLANHQRRLTRLDARVPAIPRERRQAQGSQKSLRYNRLVEQERARVGRAIVL